LPLLPVGVARPTLADSTALWSRQPYAASGFRRAQNTPPLPPREGSARLGGATGPAMSAMTAERA